MGGSVADSGIPFLSQIEGEYKLNVDSANALEEDARYNASQRRKQADLLMGEQIATFGMSGVELEGTPLELIKSDRADAEVEAMNIIYSGQMQAAQMKRRAALNKQNAYMSLVKDGASMALSGGAFSSGGGGATTMKNGGGFSSASTGTKGYTVSGGGNLANKGIA